jgi:hypothetical protein
MKAKFIGMFIGADATTEFEDKGVSYRVCNATFQEVEENEPQKGRYIVAQVWGDDKIDSIYNLKSNVLAEVEVIVSTRRSKVDKTRSYNKITLESISIPIDL